MARDYYFPDTGSIIPEPGMGKGYPFPLRKKQNALLLLYRQDLDPSSVQGTRITSEEAPVGINRVIISMRCVEPSNF